MATDIRTTQLVAEVLTSFQSAAATDVQVTQLVAEILTGLSGADAIGMAGRILWSYSGVSGRDTLIIARGTAVSGEWSLSGGSGHTYSWTFGQVTNYAGFASTATTSSLGRTFSVAGGELGWRQISSTVSAGTASLTSALVAHVAAVAVPNYFDGKVTRESQRGRRVWPL